MIFMTIVIENAISDRKNYITGNYASRYDI